MPMVTKMRFAVLYLCLVATLAAPDDQWQFFKATFSKIYSAEDEHFRHQVYLDTLEYVRKHNQEADMGVHTYRVGINEFSDWTVEEYEKYLTGDLMDEVSTDDIPEEEVVDQPIPSTVDWRQKGKVAPVKSQGSCGSCWAFASVGGLETACAIKSGTTPNLSEQQMVDCSHAYGNKGCNGGYHHYTYDYIRDCGGSVRTDCYKYTAKDGVCKFDSVKDCIACKCTGKVQAKGEVALAKHVSLGAVSVSIDARRPGFRNYKSGVYRDPDCRQLKSTHAVTTVGFATGHWIVKNSWGAKWGDKGYILMIRGENICGIGRRAYRPLV